MKKHVINMMKANSVFQFLLVLFIMVCALDSRAQTACTQTLRQARTVFDEGRIHELEGLLKDCIENSNNGFNDEERTEAYRLLILSYIYLDETEKADNAMLALLRDNPGFTINERADPTELINLHKTFRTDPIFFYGIKLGLNSTFVNVINTYTVFPNEPDGVYNYKLGFEGALFIEKKLSDRFAARAELDYSTNSFEQVKNDVPDINNQSLVEQTFIESQTSIGLSLMAHFKVFNRATAWNPYVGLGATGNYILSSDLAGDTKRSEGSSADGPNEDLIALEIRKQFNPTANLEVGLKRKVGLSYLSLNLRYCYGLSDITDRHYDNGRLTTFYGWAANDISMNSAVFSVGVLLPKYSPKKLTK